MLVVFRDGARTALSVTLGEFPSEEAESPEEPPVEPTSTDERLGFRVETLTPQLARRFGLPETDAGGLVVTEVAPFMSAARAGVRPGQRLVELEGRSVSRPSEVEAIVADLLPGEAVSARVLDPELGETVINFRSVR